jgi:hypothetical protein
MAPVTRSMLKAFEIQQAQPFENLIPKCDRKLITTPTTTFQEKCLRDLSSSCLAMDPISQTAPLPNTTNSGVLKIQISQIEGTQLSMCALPPNKIVDLLGGFIKKNDIYSLKKQARGVLVTVSRSERNKNFLQQMVNKDMEVLLPHQVKVRMHVLQEQKKVVIKGIPLDINDTDLLEILIKENKDTNIIKVERMRNKEGILTTAVALSISGSIIPPHISLYRTRKTEPFIPPIIQCSQCQRFGHSRTFCTRKPSCRFCAGDHNIKECPNLRQDLNYKESNPNRRCANCNGCHSSRYLGCPVYKSTKKALRASVEQGTSFPTEFKKSLAIGKTKKINIFTQNCTSQISKFVNTKNLCDKPEKRTCLHPKTNERSASQHMSDPMQQMKNVNRSINDNLMKMVDLLKDTSSLIEMMERERKICLMHFDKIYKSQNNNLDISWPAEIKKDLLDIKQQLVVTIQENKISSRQNDSTTNNSVVHQKSTFKRKSTVNHKTKVYKSTFI